MIVAPRRPTWARWRRLSGTALSLLRSLEYERLAGLRLDGLVLDVGGGCRNSYVHLLQIEGTLETVNIDPTMEPTYLADLNATLPIASDRYDALISLNTLEHVADDRHALAEMCRVLKPGGQAHLTVPFLYRVHGSPHDFHRHTAGAWIDMLTRTGFEPATIVVEPLAFGRLSSAFAVGEFLLPGPARWLMKKLVMSVVVLREHFRTGLSVDSECDMPLGYYVQAKKGFAESCG